MTSIDTRITVFGVLTSLGSGRSRGLTFFETREEAEAAVISLRSFRSAIVFAARPVIVERALKEPLFAARYGTDFDDGGKNFQLDCISAQEALNVLGALKQLDSGDEAKILSGERVGRSWISAHHWHGVSIYQTGTVLDAYQRQMSAA